MHIWLAIVLIPLVLSLGITLPLQPDVVLNAEAIKSKGTSLPEVGSKKVCGDKLCSEKENNKESEEKPAEDPVFEVEIIPAAENIFMLQGVGKNIGGNIAVFAGDDGLLLIDDGFASSLESIKIPLEQLKTCDKCGKVSFLINTHWHVDHVGGNFYFGEQDAVIIAHEDVRHLLSAPQELKFYEKTFDSYPKKALPSITFADSLNLHFNEESLQVIHFPNGHTSSDSIVYFTESNVLHLGDHFFNGMFPFVDLDHGGSVVGMTKNIEEILNKFPEDVTIIPGHGPIGDMNDLRAYHEMLVGTTKIVQDQMNEGKSLDEIQNNGLPDKWQSWPVGNIKTSNWIDFIYADLTNRTMG